MIKPFQRASMVLCLLALVSLPVWAQAPVTVETNRAVQVSVDLSAATVLIANPEIADVVATKSGQILVVGRRPGRTELLVLAASGKQLLSRTVVVGPAGATVTVNRGTAERTLACTPVCTEPAPPPPAQ